MTKKQIEQSINREIEELDIMLKRDERIALESEDETTREMYQESCKRLQARKYEALVIRYSIFEY